MDSYLELRDEAKLANARARTLGLTQVAIAEALGIEQSQVSRMLAGKMRRRTPAFDRLCHYLRVPSTRKKPLQIAPELYEAVMATWDGSTSHAVALATVIRTLSLLSPPP